MTPAQVFANGTASYVLPSCDAEVALTAAHDLYVRLSRTDEGAEGSLEPPEHRSTVERGHVSRHA